MPTTRRFLPLGILALSLGLATGGCDAENPDPTGPFEAAPLALSEQRPANDTIDLELERRLKTAEAAPLATLLPVDPDAVGDAPILDPTALPESVLARLAEVALPVLLPNEPALLEVAIATTGNGWYAVSMTHDGHNVYLHASRVAQRLAVPLDVPPSAHSRRAPRLTRNEASPIATFNAGGVAWALTVECDAPMTDPRCTGDEYARGLIDGLARLSEVRP